MSQNARRRKHHPRKRAKCKRTKPDKAELLRRMVDRIIHVTREFGGGVIRARQIDQAVRCLSQWLYRGKYSSGFALVRKAFKQMLNNSMFYIEQDRYVLNVRS